jgi:hypothetical protein
MTVSFLLENTTILNLSENWDRSCAVLNEAPLSGAFWRIEEMTGEKFLDELPELLLSEDHAYSGLN